MDFNKTIDCFVINLDSRKDRLTSFNEQTTKLNIHCIKFTALTTADGLLTKGLSSGQNGCLASHFRLIENAYNNDTGNYVCIFEDDAQFCDDFMWRFNYLNENIHDYDWDILYLSGFHHLDRFGAQPKSSSPVKTYDFTNHKYIHKMYSSFIMVGYIINPKSLNKVYNIIKDEISIKTNNKTRAIDAILMNLMEQRKINVYAFIPGMVSQIPGYSNIGNRTIDYNLYFQKPNICGAHVYADKLCNFNYNKYFNL
uniref:Glycosyl transferase family 25 domain-containing protein n=1 Tax=viral metagenome TaxID=1070528 RepID=A0A6C0J4M0_9ZZZZ